MNRVDERRRRWEYKNAKLKSWESSMIRSEAMLQRHWISYLSHPNVVESLNVRVDLTLKQRRNTELNTCRPRAEEITVHVQPRRFALRDAPIYAPFYYLSDDEVKRIAVRLVNRLNKEIFGNRARSRQHPQRLTALVCQHDKDSRRHLHCLFALPASISEHEFSEMLSRALKTEPFAHGIRRIERTRNLAASILYNTNEHKSLTSNPIVYLHPQLNTCDTNPKESR